MSPWTIGVAVLPLTLLTLTDRLPAATSTPPMSVPPTDSSAPSTGSDAPVDAGPLGEPSTLEVDGHLDAISPDGRWVAGTGDGGVPCIWDVESLTATCADEAVGAGESPARPSMVWSPDSQRVAFTPDVFVQARDGDIFVMDLDGGLANLTDDGYDGGLLGADAPDGLAVDTLPTWSPDSGRLAFIRSVGNADTASIMAIDPDGGEPVDLGAVPVGGRFAVWPTMTWVADDSIILTTNPVDPDDPGHGVWSIDPGTGATTEIVTGPGRVFELSGVSRDGGMALVVDPALLAQYTYSPADPAFVTAVTELDLATGESTPRPWLDVGAGELVPVPDDIDAAVEGRLAAAGGPQVYSPDGSLWFGRYHQVRRGVEYLVVGDVASGELVGALDLTSRDLAVGPAAVQWVDGGVFVKAGAGTAVWVPITAG